MWKLIKNKVHRELKFLIFKLKIFKLHGKYLSKISNNEDNNGRFVIKKLCSQWKVKLNSKKKKNYLSNQF